MEEEHLQAIKMNIEIGNYDRIYCAICGREIDMYDSEKSRQNYFDYGKICEECMDNMDSEIACG
jgi:hypothetical protein